MPDTIKEHSNGWQFGMAKTITFIVTKDCQLACKYCYLVGKTVRNECLGMLLKPLLTIF